MKLVWEDEGENGKDGGRNRQGMVGRTMRSDYGERMRGTVKFFFEERE
jgi:hypothetical protein